MKITDEMREQLSRWKCLSQNLLAFGKAEGVCYAKLLYWRNKLGNDAQRTPPAVQGADAWRRVALGRYRPRAPSDPDVRN